ncbi:Gfo/Idh/MocA family protein [Amycolatopsis suaedae]|uniref:Gfo/Idh/MocA family oxidoreductase n=1 Tax=Amycolatopsis suaedae TaxID=2510978 RepID=A0A4Q7JDN3_9PSEU|nr:Gfo/Idh/MocA family oxidoreductase [Amycolatopsis suaedae]RZQ65298.1 Gfo/Idh/MocA family oxidoreductase [Amycolatopsis suaedae]
MDAQLRVGLVGAGPWARIVHAPGLFEHPATKLTTVWARRTEAATELAEARGASVSGSFDELLDQVDAVAFAVPPAVQAGLAITAAEAGKHLILEKPIAGDLATAERLAAAIGDAGVAALVMLTLRYAPETQEWLDGVAETGGWVGGAGRWLSGALLGEAYGGSAWRHESGALVDVGPHAFDLLDAALGEITDVLSAHRADNDLWHLTFQHAGGVTSTATLSMKLPIIPTVFEVAVYGQNGYRVLGKRPGTSNECYTALLDDFAAMIDSGVREHTCDVRRGLHLQRIIDKAQRLTA